MALPSKSEPTLCLTWRDPFDMFNIIVYFIISSFHEQLRFFSVLKQLKISRVTMIVTTTPISPTGQNAEMTRFTKSPIRLILSQKMDKNLPCWRKESISLSSSLSARHSAPIFFSLFFQYFSAHFFISKIRAWLNAEKWRRSTVRK